MMLENNQEMLQQYCDNNDQTNMTLVIMVLSKYSTKSEVLFHKYGLTRVIGAIISGRTKVCNQDIFNRSWWEAHFFLAVIFKSNFFLKAYHHRYASNLLRLNSG